MASLTAAAAPLAAAKESLIKSIQAITLDQIANPGGDKLVELVAQRMAAAVATGIAVDIGGGGGGDAPPAGPTDADKEPFLGPKGAWRMSIPRTIKIDELIRLLHLFKNTRNTRQETVGVTRAGTCGWRFITNWNQPCTLGTDGHTLLTHSGFIPPK